MPKFQTANEFATIQIKNWIMDGTLAPGTWIEQSKLANELGVSRIPVRYALERLHQEGLISVVPHRGAVVRGLSRSDLEFLYSIRPGLEQLALREAFPILEEEVFEYWDELLTKMSMAIEQNDVNGYVELNREFHLSFFRCTPNPYLERIISNLYDHAVRYHRAYLHGGGGLKESLADHSLIVQATRDNNLPLALEALEAHILRTRDSLLKCPSLFENGDD